MTGLLFLATRASGAIPDLTIDSFQYAKADAAPSNWVAAAAGKPAMSAAVEQVPCLALSNAFTAGTQRGIWERTMNLDLAAHSRIAVRLKSTRPSMWITLSFETRGGGCYGSSFNITDQWVNHAFSMASFAADKNVSGWNQITKVSLSCWQKADSSPATVYVSDLRASNSRNLIANSGFELTTAEAMPDYWGPELAWGSSADEWVLNMDSWRARWGVDRTASHSGTNWITSLKDHPAVIMWYVYDEPVTPAQWLDATHKYHLAKTLDPSRPAMVNVDSTPEFLSKDWASDVLSVDYYPVGFGWVGHGNVSIAEFWRKLETMNQVASAAGKPAWCWLQSMGWAFFAFREPTGAEAEGMVYLALIHGSRGFLYFTQKPRSSEQWNELRLLNSEVRTLTPVLSSTNPPPTVSATPDAIHLVGKSYNHQTYLVAVNTLPGTIDATLKVADTDATQATVLFENRSVKVVGGQIVDNFAGYQRHVYSIP